MKLSTFSILALAAASITQAVPVKRNDKDLHFGVIARNQGTKFDCNPIKKVNSHLQVFSVGGNPGNVVSLTLKSDTTLVDQDGRGIYVNADTGDFGNVDPWGQQDPSKGFEVCDGYLIYNGKNDWKACPSAPDQYSLANNDCTGGTGIKLQVLL